MKQQLILIFSILLLSSVTFAQEKDSLTKEEKERREKNIQAGNPFKKYGYTPKIATLSDGKYLEFHDLDSVVIIGSVYYNRITKKVVDFVERDMTNPDAQPLSDIRGRWLSPDPLAEEFPSWSPYSFVYNNPLRFNDPTGMAGEDVIITGNKSQEAFQQLQSSVQGQLQLTMNSSGVVCYTQVGTGLLTQGAQQLVSAIDDSSIIVNVTATDSKLTSSGGVFVGGAFMGNSVTGTLPPIGNTVQTDQLINPNVLGAMDGYYNKAGASTLHEVAESYIGGQISQSTNISVGPAIGGNQSVYNKAHNSASPQSGPVYQTVVDANGNPVQPNANGTYQGTNAASVNYQVQEGNKPAQTIMTYP